MYDIPAFPLGGIREPFSTLSHAVGACLFLVFGILLVRRGRENLLRRWSLAVMVYASLQTLVLSSLYHMQWPGPWREFMLRADVAGIFLLIAGCITPVQTILFTGKERWLPLSIAWGTAIGGMTLRMLYFDQLPGYVGIAAFLIFGWGGAITAAILWQRYGWGFVKYAVLAGLAYTIGAVVLLNRAPTVIHGVIGPHEIWHLAVLAGLGLHWRFVFQIASGDLPVDQRAFLRGNRMIETVETIPILEPKPQQASRRAA